MSEPNSVSILISEGLVTGVNGRINPHGSTSQAEAAVILYRIYNKLHLKEGGAL